MLGPDRNGNFKMVTVKGIHENRVAIESAAQYSLVCLNIKSKEPLKEAYIRKGTCLINPLKVAKPGINPYHSICVKYFEAKIKVLHHHTTIQEGYQAVLHIGGIRQTVQAIRSDVMRTNDVGVIRFKFKYGVEYVEEG